MNKTVKTVLITVGILFMLGMGGCVASMFLVGGAVNEVVEEVDNSLVEMEEEAQNEQAVLDEIFKNAPEPKIEDDGYMKNVIYTFENKSDLDFDYIQLDLDVYDGNNVKLGTNMTNITDVKAGETFQMSVLLYQEGADHFEVNKFTNNIFE